MLELHSIVPKDATLQLQNSLTKTLKKATLVLNQQCNLLGRLGRHAKLSAWLRPLLRMLQRLDGITALYWVCSYCVFLLLLTCFTRITISRTRSLMDNYSLYSITSIWNAFVAVMYYWCNQECKIILTVPYSALIDLCDSYRLVSARDYTRV